MWMNKEIVEFKKEMGQYQDNVLKIGSLATATVSLYVWMLGRTKVPSYVAIIQVSLLTNDRKVIFTSVLEGSAVAQW